MAKITVKDINQAHIVRKRIDELEKEFYRFGETYQSPDSEKMNETIKKDIFEGKTRSLKDIRSDLFDARKELRDLIGDNDFLFKEFVTVKQKLDEIEKEKRSRAEALLNSRKKIVKEAIKKFELVTDPRIHIDISGKDADTIEGLLSDLHTAIIRIGDQKHPKAWLTMKEMMNHYSLGEETIEKIPRHKLNRILIGKGWKYSRDDMDRYLDGLGGEKQKV